MEKKKRKGRGIDYSQEEQEIAYLCGGIRHDMVRCFEKYQKNKMISFLFDSLEVLLRGQF